VAAVVAHRRASSSAPTGPLRVALIGDSYAVGLGPQLARLLPYFQYEGHVGTSTLQWARHASACGACGDWIAAYRPDVTLVALGVNDGDSAEPANYKTIADGLRGAGSRVLWVEPPAGVRTPTARVRQAIAALGVPTVPATLAPVSADGVHPQQYGPWAQEIASQLRAPGTLQPSVA
jgi:lysophospholipase L1-like esterase